MQASATNLRRNLFSLHLPRSCIHRERAVVNYLAGRDSRIISMVVAEVPLWVMHSSNASSNTTLDGASGLATGGPFNKLSDGHFSRHHHFEHKAASSLALLDSASGRARKSAIYAVDVHPDGRIFATAGGDCAVRIWNTQALFAPKNKGGSFAVAGSSDPTGKPNNATTTYVSTSASSGPEASESSAGEQESDVGPRDKMVHDLNSFVRRKKDPTVNQASAVPAETTKSSTASGQSVADSSPGRPSTHKRSHHQHRLLCTLSAHSGSSVLAVRFSSTGTYLASAGDDGCVCIYTHNEDTEGNLTQEPSPHDEHWSRIKLCRGHGLDVVDLAWAPDDSYLVSCSLDSETPIIVWKTTHLGSSRRANATSMILNPFKVLGRKEHTSTVKGVSFDPAGSYFASSGDDPAVCVWRAHDDWGLETKIDASSGIFRRWKEDDTMALSSQSLFRRISWSTDGAFLCSTNSVVKNKHVASTISRDGWSVSSASSAAAGAANLVGHKQPVVVSRHASQLLSARKANVSGGQNGDDDEEPDYATLLALGDKRGFVTIWSTKKSRPIFKLQCSESHSTVTDMAWGSLPRGDLMLLVTFLDGQVVALRFEVPSELGNLLSKSERARVFQLRYGIDVNDVETFGQRHLFTGASSGPNLIENALQMTLEHTHTGIVDMDDDTSTPGPEPEERLNDLQAVSIRSKQKESLSKGKKRIQPVLMAVTSKKTKPGAELLKTKAVEPNQSIDPLQNAIDAASKASAAMATADSTKRDITVNAAPMDGLSGTAQSNSARPSVRPNGPSSWMGTILPHSSERIHSLDLPLLGLQSMDVTTGFAEPCVAECTNSVKLPVGSRTTSIPCVDVALSRDGKISWKDQIPGTSCSAIAASTTLMAVGTTDGCLQLYGTSPTIGWTCGQSFRSHPSLVLGHPIVSLQLQETQGEDDEIFATLLTLTGDGTFAVYSVLPVLQLQFKGSVMPAMSHMALGTSLTSEQHSIKISRIQITETNRVLLLLSLQTVDNAQLRGGLRGTTQIDAGVGGSLQAFVFDQKAELWMKAADNRFVLSDFYSALPSAKFSPNGELSRLEDAVRIGALQASMKPAQRGRLRDTDRHADEMFSRADLESGNFIPTRAHCEDRMACAIALESADEFKKWLSLYIKVLCVVGHTDFLRVLVDILMNEPKDKRETIPDGMCWWMSIAPTVVGLDKRTLVRSLVIPEMSKNRGLQRLTNEISLELTT